MQNIIRFFLVFFLVNTLLTDIYGHIKTVDNDSLTDEKLTLFYGDFQQNIEVFSQQPKIKKWINNCSSKINVDSVISIFSTEHNSLSAYLNYYLKENLEQSLALTLLTYQNFSSLDKDKNQLNLIDYYPAVVSNWHPKYQSKFGAGIYNLSFPVSLKYGLIIDLFTDERKEVFAANNAFQSYYNHILEKQNNQENLAVLALSLGLNSYNYYLNNSLLPDFKKPLEDKESFNIFLKTIEEPEKELYFALQAFELVYKSLLHYIDDDLIKPLYGVTIIPEKAILTKILTDILDLNHLDFLTNNAHFSNDSIIVASEKEIVFYFEEDAKAKLFENKYQKIIDSSSVKIEQLKLEAEKRAKELQALKEKETEYVVAVGDNLGLIAQKFKVSVNDIKNWNNLKNDIIYPKQKLKIIAALTKIEIKEEEENKQQIDDLQITTEIVDLDEDKYLIHIVKEGESLWLIANQYEGVGLYDIIKLNQHVANENKIDIGQKLKIKLKDID